MRGGGRFAFFVALATLFLALAAAPARAVTIFTNITLLNGWTAAPGETRYPGVSLVNGVVHMKGAIAGGASAQAFKVPQGFRPITNVYVRVDLCNGEPGRILITPAGDGSVQAASSFASAQCRASLESVKYALNSSDFTSLSLQNGWTAGPFGTAAAGSRKIGEVVQLRGAVASGATSTIATLPVDRRPSADIYAPINLCDAKRGRLRISPAGVLTVSTDSPFAAAQCFTSLEGVSFLAGTGGYPAIIQNGWNSAPFSTRSISFSDVAGVLYLQGAVSSGSAARIFTLPPNLRPTSEIFAPVDLCNGLSGSLRIAPSGNVSVNATGPFTDAQCFTSLEGVSFALSAFAPLNLVNGWNAASVHNAAAIARSGNIVTFTGLISGGDSGQIATLPASYRPPTNVYLAALVCNGEVGRLVVQPSGALVIEAGSFSDAQCLTSLEGASYLIPNAQTKDIAPKNGWVGGALGANTLRFQLNQGWVRFSGALSGGANSTLLTLPPSLRPYEDVYEPVVLCSAARGTVFISKSGAVTIIPHTNLADAQCMTSLDGVEYRTNLDVIYGMNLMNGWQAIDGTIPGGRDVGGIVHLSGMIAPPGGDLITTLSNYLRPDGVSGRHVLAPVDLCKGAQHGAITINASGNMNHLVQCGSALSLNGVRYAK